MILFYCHNSLNVRVLSSDTVFLKLLKYGFHLIFNCLLFLSWLVVKEFIQRGSGCFKKGLGIGLIVLFIFGFQSVSVSAHNALPDTLLHNKEPLFVFESIGSASDEMIRCDKVHKHFLGKNVAIYLYRLKYLYTFTKNDDYYDNKMNFVIRKRKLYLSVKRLGRYFKKMVIKRSLSKSSAEFLYLNILQKSIDIYYLDTKILEDELSKCKSSEAVVELFSRVSINYL